MEYIECTHCGKRYAASRVKHNVGKYIRCDNCLEKFQAVVKTLKNKEGSSIEKSWNPTLTAAPERVQGTLENSAPPLQAEAKDLPEQEVEVMTDTDERKSNVADWNPAETMPETPPEQHNDDAVLADDTAQDKAEEILREIQQTKKKKFMVYALLLIVLALLGLSLWMLFPDDEPQAVVTHNVQVAPRLSAEDVDKKNVECRIAAARQWLLDDKVMHQSYDAKVFMNMIQQAKHRAEDVKAACKNTSLLEEILDAVTQGKKPDWFAAEIQALSRK